MKMYTGMMGNLGGVKDDLKGEKKRNTNKNVKKRTRLEDLLRMGPKKDNNDGDVDGEKPLETEERGLISDRELDDKKNKKKKEKRVLLEPFKKII